MLRRKISVFLFVIFFALAFSNKVEASNTLCGDGSLTYTCNDLGQQRWSGNPCGTGYQGSCRYGEDSTKNSSLLTPAGMPCYCVPNDWDTGNVPQNSCAVANSSVADGTCDLNDNCDKTIKDNKAYCTASPGEWPECTCATSPPENPWVKTTYPKAYVEPPSNAVLCTTTKGDQGVNTALGCIPIGSSGFTSWILGWLFGIAGGIAFLLMVYGFILVATSGGDEKKVAGAKETITSAIVGLLVCIFAVFILKLVAVNILNIPGF